MGVTPELAVVRVGYVPITPLFYRNQEQFLDVMLHAIALNGSFFNTHRMVLQYALKAYR